MIPTRSTRARRGMMLTEVVVTVALTGLFLLLFLPVWRGTWRAMTGAPAAEAAAFSADAAAARLRADAWSASLATLAADGALELSPEPAVRWSAERIELDGNTLVRLTRNANGAARVHDLPDAAPAEPPRFEVAAGRVVLHAAGRVLTCPTPLRERPR